MIMKMRDIAPTFILIAALAFVATIFFSWGMDFTGISATPGAGTIEGKRVGLDVFDRMVTMERQRMEQSYDGEVPPEQSRSVPRQVWERLVSEQLMQRVFREMRLGASADEIFAHLRRNPPPGLDTMEHFKTNGIFDTAKYEELLNNPAVYDQPGWRDLESHVQRFVVPTGKLEALLKVGATPSKLEVEREYRERTDRVAFEYAHCPLSAVALDSTAIGDDAVGRYYSAHRDSFRVEDQADLYYVTLPKKVTPADEKMYHDELVEIAGRVRAKESTFEDEARTESDDKGSAENGGDLGWFGKGAMVPEFEAVAFAAAPGTICEPVRSQFGYHLIQVVERRGTKDKAEVHARHILRKVSPSLETLDSLKGVLDSIVDQADSAGSLPAAVAGRQDMRVDSTGLFARSGMAPGIGFVSGLMHFAFSGQAGDVSESVFENREAFFVCQLKRRVPAGVLSLDDARERIRRTIGDSLRLAGARERLDAAAAKLVPGESLLELKQADTAFVCGVSDTVTRAAGFVPALGFSTEAVATAFSVAQGEVSDPVTLSGGVCVVRPLWRAVADSIPWASVQVAQVRSGLAGAEQQRAFLEWYVSYKEKANVKSTYDKYYLE